MQITDGKNGTTNLNVNSDEFDAIVDSMKLNSKNGGRWNKILAEIEDWFEYKRLRAKFSPAEFEAAANAVKSVLSKP